MEINEITEQTFAQAERGDALVEFFSPECSYCRLAEPVLRRLSDEYSDVVFFKLNVKKNERLTENYGIKGLPTFVLLSNGQEVGRTAGAGGDPPLRSLLNML